MGYARGVKNYLILKGLEFWHASEARGSPRHIQRCSRVTHSYFFSWEHAPTRGLEVDWLDARNICRRHCMDAVSLETPQENEFIKQRIARGNIRYIWTSGRKCNFAGCDRPDLQPPNINGWFWSGSGAKIGPTTQRNTGDLEPHRRI
ncbi:hypothetical protein NQ317_016031 [Molorchus minor]|uniref:C-type lectin domain-containing protein n=1 Tax=Molorchus minor TaxID=1323400 RepID=A0ABQ9JAA9_9CUCU|nr:hypothetical protein NQ317_016031 [Molorchus minor]